MAASLITKYLFEFFSQLLLCCGIACLAVVLVAADDGPGRGHRHGRGTENTVTARGAVDVPVQLQLLEQLAP